MLTDDGKHLYVSWDEYHRHIERLALKVAHSGWEFVDMMARGLSKMRDSTSPGRMPPRARHRIWSNSQPL